MDSEAKILACNIIAEMQQKLMASVSVREREGT
jgi:hypothetical protein